jgi:MFS family permease
VSASPSRAALLGSAALMVAAGPILAPGLPAIREAFSAVAGVDALLPLLVTLPSLSIAVTAPLAGRLVDRGGARGVLLAALAVYVGAGVAPLWLSRLEAILAARAVLGVAAAVAMVGSTAIALRSADTRERGRFLAAQAALMSLAAVAAVATGGVASSWHWRAPFSLYALALPVLVALAAATRGLPSEPGADLPRSSPPPASATIAFAGRGHLLLVAGAMAFVFMVPLQLPFLLARRGHGPAVAGLAVALCGVSSAAASLFVARRAAHPTATAVPRGPSTLRWCAWCGAALGAAYLAIGAAPSLTVTCMALPVAGVASGALLPQLLQAGIGTVPVAARAARVGALTSAIYAGQFAAPWLSRMLARAAADPDGFLAAGMSLVAAAGVALVVQRIGPWRPTMCLPRRPRLRRAARERSGSAREACPCLRNPMCRARRRAARRRPSRWRR